MHLPFRSLSIPQVFRPSWSGIFVVLSLLLSACGNSDEQIAFFNRKNRPIQEIEKGHIVRSEKGKLQMVMDAPLIQTFNEPVSLTRYPKGLKAVFYSGVDEPKASLSCRFAEQRDGENIILARDSVVIIDLKSHDTVFLRELTWDQNQKRIFSSKPIRMQNGRQVTYGDSFESDEGFENMVIMRQHGTMEWSDTASSDSAQPAENTPATENTSAKTENTATRPSQKTTPTPHDAIKQDNAILRRAFLPTERPKRKR